MEAIIDYFGINFLMIFALGVSHLGLWFTAWAVIAPIEKFVKNLFLKILSYAVSYMIIASGMFATIMVYNYFGGADILPFWGKGLFRIAAIVATAFGITFMYFIYQIHRQK